MKIKNVICVSLFVFGILCGFATMYVLEVDGTARGMEPNVLYSFRTTVASLSLMSLMFISLFASIFASIDFRKQAKVATK